jgi:hypothetical protein
VELAAVPPAAPGSGGGAASCAIARGAMANITPNPKAAAVRFVRLIRFINPPELCSVCQSNASSAIALSICSKTDASTD